LKRNNAFCCFFLEKEEYIPISIGSLGACPTPRVSFAENWVANDLPRSGTTLFASFSGKEGYHKKD
jgi:hypothetical protein